MIRAFDEFTDADTTALESHAASDGGSWTKHSNSGAGSVTIDNNRVHNPNDTTMHMYYHSWAPVVADYAVTVGVVMRSDNNASMAGPAVRIATGANTCYYARYFTNGNFWQILKVVSGSTTALGSTVAQTLTVDQIYLATLEVRDTALILSVDGVVIREVTDTSITSAGRAGIRVQDAASATTGVHLDSWQVAA